MSDEPGNKSPVESLARAISKALTKKGVILEQDADKMTLKISTGRVKESDWRIAIEKAIDKENKDAEGSN